MEALQKCFTEKNTHIIYIIVLVIIFCIAFQHIIELTQFAFKYNSAYDYGKFLQGVCLTEYFEYETSRFQVNSQIDDIKLPDNRKNYMTVILVISIIVSCIISIIFAIMVARITINFNYISNENRNKWYYIFIVCGIILLICIISLPPLFIGLKLVNNIDISPFNKDSSTAYIICIVISVIILIFRLFNVLNVTEYFKTNNKTLEHGFIFLLCMVVYICMFYIMGNVINIYNNFKCDSKDYNVDLFSEFMNNVLGFQETQKFEDNKSYVYTNKLSGTSFTLFIIIVVLFSVFLLINYGYKYIIGEDLFKDSDKYIFKYGIIAPLLALFLVMYTCNLTIEYNHLVNKYILCIPSIQYKNHLNFLNTKALLKGFNGYIAKNYNNNELSKNQYICRNKGNAILLVLYSHLFDGLDKIDRNGTKPIVRTIDITPEFEYEESCEEVQPFEFDKLEEYKISYYLNGKGSNKNIFYKFNNCNELNIESCKKLIVNVFKVLFPNVNDTNLNQIIFGNIFNDDTTLRGFLNEDKTNEKVEIQIQNILDKNYLFKEYIIKPKHTNFEEFYKKIQQKVGEEDEEAKFYKGIHENIKTFLKNYIDSAINNISNNNVYHDDKMKYIYYSIKDNKYYYKAKQDNVTLNKYEIYAYNNKIALKKYNIIDSGYSIITDIIIYKYIRLVYLHLYNYKNLYNEITNIYTKLKEEKNIKKENDIDVSDKQNIQKEAIENGIAKHGKKYITEMTQAIIKTFDEINKILASPIYQEAGNKLSKYLIANYNSLQSNDQIYRGNLLHECDATPKAEAKIASDINNFENLYINPYDKFLKTITMVRDYLKDSKYKENVEFITNYQNLDNLLKMLKLLEGDDANMKFFDSIYDNSNYIYNLKSIDTKNDINQKNLFTELKKVSNKVKIDIDDLHKLLQNTNSNHQDIALKYIKIESYLNFLKVNITALKRNLEDEINKQLKNRDIQNEQNSEENLFNKQTSKKILQNAMSVDKFVYLLIINYVVIIGLMQLLRI